MHSLRTKITLLALCVAIVTVAVVSMLSVLFIRNAEHNKSDQLLLLLCETGEKNLNYYFKSVEKSVQKIAAYTQKDLDGLDDEKLLAHTDRVRGYFDEIANKTNGVFTYYYRIDPAVSSVAKGFWYTNLDGQDFTEHEVTDITLYDTADTSKLVWFTVPKQTGKPVWLPPYITDNLDMQVITYVVPVYWRGQFVGVIGIEIDYSVMAEQVGSIHLYNNGYAFLTGADGNLIYHPRIDIAALGTENLPASPEGLFSESTFSHYTFEGVKKEAVWLRLSNGMRLYVSVPEAETDGDWEQLIREVLIAAAIVLVLAVVLTRIFSVQITRPLQKLTEAALQADQGNYDFTLDYNGRDEVGTLTKTFKHMAVHVKEHISDLNKRVFVDALTSVRNKGGFTAYIDELQKNLSDAPEETSFAIGVFDCDDLKSVNDRCGHDKGDLYLKTACRLVCRVFQHSPVFRIGGDEFSVILRGDDLLNRESLVASFENAAGEINAEARNPWEQVHLAMGIAVYDPAEDRSVMDTVRRADKIMYTNKRARKNTGSSGSPG